MFISTVFIECLLYARHFTYFNIYSVSMSTNIVAVLQMRKLKCKEVKLLSKSHWHSQALNSVWAWLQALIHSIFCPSDHWRWLENYNRETARLHVLLSRLLLILVLPQVCLLGFGYFMRSQVQTLAVSWLTQVRPFIARAQNQDRRYCTRSRLQSSASQSSAQGGSQRDSKRFRMLDRILMFFRI